MLIKSNDFSVVPNILNDFLRDFSSPNFSKTNTTLPAVNIGENEHNYVVEVAAPGLDKKDFKINIENDVLTISSEKTTTENTNEDNYTRKEYSYQSFKRSFSLPKGSVDDSNVKASYINGELKITIPKVSKEKTARLIEVE